MKETALKKGWSPALKEQTRESVNQMRIAPDGLLHLKHQVNGYGSISAEDLIGGIISIKSSTHVYEFKNIDELLGSDWAID